MGGISVPCLIQTLLQLPPIDFEVFLIVFEALFDTLARFYFVEASALLRILAGVPGYKPDYGSYNT
ncbi:MAG: hypothetical protein HOC20_00600 [Chloroflexi bacterium]|nr:hypothetical protein [Chloroflexota bacterium]